MRRTPRVLALARSCAIGSGILLALTTMLTQGCVADSGATSSRKVAFVGDSILNISRSELLRAAPPRSPEFQVIAENGKQIAEMQAIVPASVWDAASDTWFVVQLGTNDEAYHNPSAIEHLWSLEERLRPSPCVVWVTVNEYIRDDPVATAIAQGLNDTIRAAAAFNPRYHVYDWNGTVHGPPDRSLELVADGAHPNAEGRELLAADLWAAVRESCGA